MHGPVMGPCLRRGTPDFEQRGRPIGCPRLQRRANEKGTPNTVSPAWLRAYVIGCACPALVWTLNADVPVIVPDSVPDVCGSSVPTSLNQK